MLPTSKEAEMQRSLLLAAMLLPADATVLHAQQATNDANPLFRPLAIRMGTISVPPIAGAPFSATALIENRQVMSDGTVAASRNINLIGRDSRGRTHGEMRSRVPESSQDMPPLIEVHIYDPQTRVQTIWYTATHIASHQVRPEPISTGFPNRPDPQVTVEDLGPGTLNGIDVKGTRRTVTVPAQMNGMGAPITVVDEYWYSEDLHVNILLRHTDPRTGLQTVALSNIKREEPPLSFFEVPADYKVVDLTPPPGAPMVSGHVVAGRPRP
jgi:hypothetical protein